MKQLILLLFILYVAAIKIRFVKESTAGPIADRVLDSQNQQSSSQQSDDNSYLADLPQNLSRLVLSAAAAALARDGLESSEASPITVPLRCKGDWEYAKAVLRIVDGTAKELPTEMTETKAGRTHLIDIYHALQIQDFSYNKRFVDALCVVKRDQPRISDPVGYLKVWLCVFYPSDIYVPDNYWLDLFCTMREQDPMWYCHMQSYASILETVGLSPYTPHSNGSRMISAILWLLREQETSLSVPYRYFLKGGFLNGRFSEVVDIVRRVTSDNGLIFSSNWPSNFRNKDPRKIMELDRHVCTYALNKERLFVSMDFDLVTSPTWIREVLIELLPRQVTDLFLKIPDGIVDFWEKPVTDSMDVISTLATQPLSNLWIYCDYYTPHFVKMIEKRLSGLKQVTIIYNHLREISAQEMPVFAKIQKTMILDLLQCEECIKEKRLCLEHWLKFVNENVREAPYTLPSVYAYPETPAGGPFDTSGLRLAIDKASLKRETKDSLSDERAHGSRKRRR